MRRLKNIFAIFMMIILFGTSSALAADKYARVVLVGDLSGGKTSLWKRILGYEFDMTEARSDLMVRENVTKTINNQEVQFNVWDTAGAESYYNEVVAFTQNADFVIIVHDIIKPFDVRSESYINKLYSDIHEKIKSTGKIIIVGSKYDKRHSNIVNAGRQITMLEGVAKAIPCAYISCSSKIDGDRGIATLTDFLFNRYYSSMELSSSDPDSGMLKRFEVKKGGGLCILL